MLINIRTGLTSRIKFFPAVPVQGSSVAFTGNHRPAAGRRFAVAARTRAPGDPPDCPPGSAETNALGPRPCPGTHPERKVLARCPEKRRRPLPEGGERRGGTPRGQIGGGL